jgi:ABC-type phosphate/phosphonate transport system ATPase subunit
MVSTPLTVGSGVPSPQNIDSWKQYLTSEDYAYLFQYIENIKNGISNDKMIILAGPDRTGKSTLIKNISSYLGDELCGNYPMSGEFIYDKDIKPLGFFCGIDGISKSKKNNQAIINFIKYKQSFIADTIHIERVNTKLLEYSKIIMMTHIF